MVEKWCHKNLNWPIPVSRKIQKSLFRHTSKWKICCGVRNTSPLELAPFAGDFVVGKHQYKCAENCYFSPHLCYEDDCAALTQTPQDCEKFVCNTQGLCVGSLGYYALCAQSIYFVQLVLGPISGKINLVCSST